MLELRPCCENCGRNLPPATTDARICSFECTFCTDCAREVLHDVCPNCGGGLTPRPIRPKDMLAKHPPVERRIVRPVDPGRHAQLLERYRDVPPEQR